MSSSFFVTLDRVGYARKPEGPEVGLITNRMKAARPTELDASGLADALRQGMTWCGATFEPGGEGWGRFLGQQVFALDFDNTTGYPRKDGTKGKRPLYPDEAGHITPTEAVDRCHSLGIEPMLLHRTLHDRPDNVRFRVVLDMGRPVTEEAEACELIAALLQAFPEADKACSNPNRLFFGSNGSVCELWRGEVPS